MSRLSMLGGTVLLSVVIGSVVDVWASTPQTILVLYGDAFQTPGTLAFTEGLREGLATAPVQFEAQYVEVARFAEEVYGRAFADFLEARYRDQRIAAIVAVGVPASVFAARFGADIWPGARIVHAGIDGPHLNILTERGDPVVARRFDYARIVETAIVLFPEIRRITLIGGASDQDRRWMAEAERDLVQHGSGITVERLEGLRFDETIARIRQLPADGVGILVTFFEDADSRTFVTADAVVELARAANRPVFVTLPARMGTGALGGYVVDPKRLGRRTAVTVRQVLALPPSQTPPQTDSHWIFDAAQLRRWNVDEARLPADSVVINRPSSFWREYRVYVVGATSLLVLEGGLIAALLLQRSRRRRAELAVRAREATLQASHSQIRDLAGRLITAQEKERSRIARELHDDFGQRLASLSIGLSNAKFDAAESKALVRERLYALQAHTIELAKDLRTLSHELHPGTLEHIGLVEALRGRCNEVSVESDLSVSLDTQGDWSSVPDDIALCLYRVAQEALRNVVEHARANTACVSLARENDSLVMRVSDDGVGFHPNGSCEHRGLGLMSMRERVQMAGGRLEMRSSPGAGTVAEVTLPMTGGR